MMIDAILDKLTKVRKTGNGQWMACCPAHPDKNPTMGIRELDDRVLLHCFAGCSVEDILGAIGLTFDDLYSPRVQNHVKGAARPFPATDALRMIAIEAMVVAATAVTLRTRALNKVEGERLLSCVNRINGALSACGIKIGKW